MTRRPSMPIALSAALFAAGGAIAQEEVPDTPPSEVRGVDIIEERGAQIPLDLSFMNADGAEVSLSAYFDGERPVVLIFGYYSCPSVCPLIFNNANEAFKELDWTLGEEYRAVNVSFDHRDTPETSREVRAAKRYGYGRDVADDAWAFLTSDAQSVRELADAVGYKYRYLPAVKQYSHPSGIVVLSPTGVVSNYLYGVQYPANQLKPALYDAADGKVGSVFNRVILWCFAYNPDAGKYTLVARRVMLVGALATATLLAGFLAAMFITDRTRRAARRRAHDAPPGALHA